MSTQWHPVFAELLKLLLADFYEIQTEVPVSDLPRRGDFLILRKQGGPEPPFRGIWNHLTDWNVLEFKGPTDDAEEEDLDKLVHVGTGIAYRLNEQRRAAREPPLANRQVSFWYVARALGETFRGHAQARGTFRYEGGGLWRGVVWGHLVFLLSSREAAVEEDSIPLYLIGRDEPPPRALGELVVAEERLLKRFAGWVQVLQPAFWKEMQIMAKSSGVIDWEAVSQVTNLDEVVRFLPPERVVAVLGVEQAIKAIGLSRVIAEVGLSRVIAEVGLSRVISEVGADKVLDELQASMSAEEWEEMVRRRTKKE